MQYLFKGLNHIKKVDLSKFNLKPIDTSYMLSGCTKLEEVIFGDFDTFIVETMEGMF